jgi:polysaccharide biosynthesis/export protein
MVNLKVCVEFSDDRNCDCVGSGGCERALAILAGGDSYFNHTDLMPHCRRSLRLIGALLLICSASGCHFIYPGRDPGGPVPMVPDEIPRELCKTTLPDYIIEPPDVLSIEAISLLPKEPYHLRPLDVIAVSAIGSPEVAAISGQYNILPNGTIVLPFGETVNELADRNPIRVVGRNVEDIQNTIATILNKYYNAAQVSVTIAELAAQQQIVGEHLVAPDGKVNLGTYGRVRLVGMTIEEARAAVEAHLSTYLEEPQIALDVLGYNSKVYYVVTQGAGLGDRVVILPAKGNETVLDAIGQVQGLDSNSSTRMWIARPGKNSCDGDQLLPVDWLAVTQRGDTATNYQILPGDRLFVSEDKLVAFDTRLGKIISPFERIAGFVALGTSTTQNLVFFNQNGRGSNSGF